jgi:hypothetical protein
VRDKSDDVRHAAISGLGRLFGQCISIPSLASVVNMRGLKRLSDAVDEDTFSRLRFIPGLLMKSWNNPNPRSKYLILQLLQEYIFPCRLSRESKEKSRGKGSKEERSKVNDSSPSESDSQDSDAGGAHEKGTRGDVDALDDHRAAAMLLLFECLSPDDRTTLGLIMQFKATACASLQSVVDLQTMHSISAPRKRVARTDPQPDVKEQRAKLSEALVQLMACLPSPDHDERAEVLLESEQDVYRQLQICTSSTNTAQSCLTYRAELREYLSESAGLAQCTAEIWTTAGYLLTNEGTVQSLLTFAVQQASLSGALAAESTELLSMIAKRTPQCFQHSTQEVLSLLTTCSAGERDTSRTRGMKESMLSHCTDIVSRACVHFQGRDVQKQLCSKLVALIDQSNCPEFCSKLAGVLSQLAYCSEHCDISSPSTGSGSAVELAQGLIVSLSSAKRLTLRNNRLPCDLSVLAVMVSTPMRRCIGTRYPTRNF